ncbi:MAG TPA: hypothetical protein DCY20_07380 [Firmicutes bacterium]|nr:hypothetical protein [Bacillota bacterium]
MKDTLIVPIRLNDNSTTKETNSKLTSSDSAVCHLKIKDAEVSFHNGVDKYILHAVLAEVSKYAR